MCLPVKVIDVTRRRQHGGGMRPCCDDRRLVLIRWRRRRCCTHCVLPLGRHLQKGYQMHSRRASGAGRSSACVWCYNHGASRPPCSFTEEEKWEPWSGARDASSPQSHDRGRQAQALRRGLATDTVSVPRPAASYPCLRPPFPLWRCGTPVQLNAERAGAGRPSILPPSHSAMGF